MAGLAGCRLNMKKFVIVRDIGLMNSPFVALPKRSGAEGRP